MHRSSVISYQLSVIKNPYLSSSSLLNRSVSICVYLWLISFFLFSFSIKANAQVKPVYDQGAIGLGQLLKRLNNTKSVMHIGAHPDDEDSDLLAYLASGGKCTDRLFISDTRRRRAECDRSGIV